MEAYLTLLAGAIGVPLVNLLKEKLQLEGFYAFALASAVSVVLALVGMFVEGGWSLADFTYANLAEVFGGVIGWATFIYKLLNRE